MTELLSWRDEWLLGIEPLDQDHQRLVSLVNHIIERFTGDHAAQEASAADPCGLTQALEELCQEARAHFAREEAFIRAIDSPGLAQESSEHALLLAEYRTIFQDLKRRGACVLDEVAAEELKRWVIEHLLAGDRSYAEHYFRLCGQG